MIGKFTFIKKLSVMQLDCLGAIGLLALILATAYWLLPSPDPAAAEKVNSLFIPMFRNDLQPEIGEQRTYLLGLILLPVIAGLSVWFQRRGIPPAAGGCLWLGFFGIMLFYRADWIRANFSVTAGNGSWRLVACLVFALTLGGLFWRRFKLSGKLIWWTVIFAGFFFTVGFSLYNPAKMLNYFTLHWEVICYAVSQSALGSPTLHQYGFYPDFLSVIFHFFEVNIRNLNVILSLFNFIAFLAIFVAFWQFCRNKVIALVYAVLLIFVSNSLSGTLNGREYDPYFAYCPIRTIVPAISIFLMMIYLKYPRRWVLPVLGAVAGAGVFWNLDSGITVAVAIFSFLAVETLAGSLRKQPDWRPLKEFAFWFAAVLAGVWLLLCWRHGMWLTPQVVFKYQKIFAVSGYFMLPVQPLPGAWGFFAGVPVIALVWGFFMQKNSPGNATARWVLYLAILSLGLFSYYMGRSHLLVLTPVIYPVLVILAVWLDGAVRLSAIRELKKYSILLSVPVLVLFALTVPMSVNVLPQLITAGSSHMVAAIQNEPGVLEEKAQLIRSFANGGKINIFGNHQGLLYMQSQTVSGIADGGEIEVILLADLERIWANLADSPYPLVICDGDPMRLPMPQQLLNQKYRLVQYDPAGIRFYVPKKEAVYAQ